MLSADAKAKKATLKLSSKLALKEGESKTLKLKKQNVQKIKSQKWSSNRKATAVPKATNTPEPTATVNPDTVLVTGTVTADNTTLRMPHDNGTNISDTPVTTIVSGGTIEITKKDNGVMRTDITAKELASTAVGSGINVGNTLEAYYGVPAKYPIIAGADETKYDNAWSQPVLTQEYFDTLHSYGINTVRIPVSWSNGDSDDGTYQIDEETRATGGNNASRFLLIPGIETDIKKTVDSRYIMPADTEANGDTGMTKNTGVNN